MPKRHAARPTLESVEDRLVLSTSSLLEHAHAAHVAHYPHAAPAHATHAMATHRHKAVTRKSHHATNKDVNHTQKNSSGLSSLSDSFSGFLKSIGL